MKRFWKYLLPAIMAVTVSTNSCHKDDPDDDGNKTVSVTGLKLDISEQQLTTGDDFVLTATIEPEGATNKTLNWSTNNSNILKVEPRENGTAKVTALTTGRATVAVSADDGGFSANCVVTVVINEVPVTGVTLTPDKLTINKIGGTAQLTAAVEPSDATNQLVQFSSDNEEVVTVDATGKLTAKALGKAIVTAKTSDGGFTKQCEITVYIPITSATFDIEDEELYEGQNFTLTLTIEPDNAVPNEIKWASDNPDAATVDEDGNVTAIAEGIANITANVDGTIASCKVTVSKLRIKNLTLNAEEKLFGIGETFELKFTVEPEIYVYSEVEWESDNPTVVAVDENGKLTALDEGIANITVTVDGVSAVCKTLVALKITVKREFRAAWMVTVWNIDWPPSTNETTQKQRFIDYLDMYKAANMNAVFVQVRGRADPFWNSEYESWSPMLTGTRGQAPMYDVMNFMITECHKRGIEFHAWMNPFRVETRTAAPLATNPWPATLADPKIPKELVKDYPNIRVYNPALPEVHQRLADIVEELITTYRDIDGIHFDDYFYPEVTENGSTYSTSLLNDDAEFKQYGQGFSFIADWRRDNVNKVIQKIGDVIKRVNPKVVFSISPQANESNNMNSLFADIFKWCQNAWIDMVIPQVYYVWGSGSSQFQGALNNWSNKYGPLVPTIVGLPLYRIAPSTDNWPAAHFDNMLDAVSKAANIKGSVIYSTSDFAATGGDKATAVANLKSKYYNNPAVRPEAFRKTEPVPATPANLTLTGTVLSWTPPVAGMTAVVYMIPEDGSVMKVVAITSENSVTVTEKGRYTVTALNRNNVESLPAKSLVFSF